MQDKKIIIEKLLFLYDEELNKYIKQLHPIDVIEAFDNCKIDIKISLLSRISNESIARLLDYTDDKLRLNLLNLVDKERHKDILNHMLSNELVDFIENIEDLQIQEHYRQLIDQDNIDINKMLSYKEDTAGSLMATEFINVYESNTVLDTYKFLQETLEDNDMPYYLYITDKKNKLLGFIALRDLVSSKFDTLIKDITNYNVNYVTTETDQEEVAHIFDKYDYMMLPVVDEHQILLGVISVDDIIEVVKEETTEDMHKLAGLDKDERVDGSIFESLKSRLPWLLVNLFTASLSALVISYYSDTISSLVLLAAINPIISAIGGNVGNQSMILIVRSLALKQISNRNAIKIFIKEISVGLIVGLFIGLILGLIVTIYSNNYYFGLITALAILINLSIASTLGFIVPVTLSKIKVDPAIASSIFVTSITDILGFLIYLSLATMTLQLII